MKMNKYLIKLADHLDKKGLYKEADYVDWIISKTAGDPMDEFSKAESEYNNKPVEKNALCLDDSYRKKVLSAFIDPSNVDTYLKGKPNKVAIDAFISGAEKDCPNKFAEPNEPPDLLPLIKEINKLGATPESVVSYLNKKGTNQEFWKYYKSIRNSFKNKGESKDAKDHVNN